MSQKAYSQGSTFPATKPGVLRIYSMRFCPYAERTRLVLSHKNIPHEIVNINLKSKPDWFLALNPLGQVPVLQIDDKIVPESTATCDWLDDVYPENRLQPADPYRRAWDRVYASYNGSLLSNDPFELHTNLEGVKKHLQFFEDKLRARGDGPFFGGSKPCIFDFMFWPTFVRLPIIAIIKENPAANIDENEFPTLETWAKAMKELPAIKDDAFDVERHAIFFRGHVKGTPDYDMFLDE
ncbi:hypothetical protein RRG08_015927 [Elysia crispata]|uniref:Glutathione S-transferase omega n=1 Tax=Elysia crispata TaxID=231223 RepID=A0AAE1AML0_9GAST|nr:hypothetical protein RRG08_015927 [Elysia crispata]